MIEHSFLHIAGIGAKTEQRWWAAGVNHWDAFSPDGRIKLTAARKATIDAAIAESRAQLACGNAAFFARDLPAAQQWRLFAAFRQQVAYLDIETTGLEADCTISTIALYDGTRTATFVNGDNLDDFMAAIARYGLIVTFNGKCFDVPVIERHFGQRLPQAHIDLRYVLASLGLKGGLKACERQLGIDRGDLEDVDGLFAVVLWKAYLRNRDPRALETLLSYNLQDAINLETLMVTAYNLKLAQTPFGERLKLPLPPPAPNPIPAHRAVIEHHRREAAFIRSLQPRW